MRRKCKSNRNNLYLKQRLKLATKSLKRLMRIERTKYISKCMAENNMKRKWQNINKLMGRGSHQRIAVMYDKDNKLVTDATQIANMFNNEFIDSVNKLKSDVAENSSPVRMETLISSIMLDEVTEQDVATAIMALKNSSAPGIDGIKVSHVKALSQLLLNIIAHLANRIFETATFPALYKTAIISPISKSHDWSNISDYRPISVLNVFSKIIEKLIYNRMSGFTNERHKLISNKQFGFRKKCSTEVAALELVDYITHAIDSKKKVSVVFMDMKKAFDTVDIPKLLEVLNAYGIRGNALNLMESYLTDRSQVVRVNGKLSSARTFTGGVVQGSILGPYLFSLFFNQITKLPVEGNIFLFADDCAIANIHDLKEPVQTKIQKDMNIIINFVNSRSLIFNSTKTNFMLFNSSHTKVEDIDEICINNVPQSKSPVHVIKRVYSTKYLGLKLDPNLKWDDHIHHIEGKAANVSGVLWKMRKLLPQHAKKLIYQALLEPHLTYLVSIWGNATDTALKSLQIMQNRALRNVYNLNRLTNRNDMYLNLVDDFMPVRALCYIHTAAFVFNTIHEKIHTNIIFHVNDADTRQKGDLRPRKARTLYGSKSILTIGSKIFNDVPSHIQNLPHVHAFKWQLRRHIRSTNSMELFLSSEYLSKFA